MSWINRFIAPIGSAAALAVALAAMPARADAPISATFAGQTIRFSHVAASQYGTAVGVEDPGFAQLLRATGSVLTWKPGERYVLITTGAPVVVSFAVGDRRYDVGPISMEAGFAPYLVGNEAYLPLSEVLRSLDLAMRQDAGGSFIVPQVSTLDVQSRGGGVTVVAHAGAPLHPRVTNPTPGQSVYEFDGVGTSLGGVRNVNAGGVRAIAIEQTGPPRDPKTVVTVTLQPGTDALAPRATDDRDVILAFSNNGMAAQSQPAVAAAPAGPPVAPAPGPSNVATENPAAEPPSPAGPATVTNVTLSNVAGGSSVISVFISGDAQFEWHRLRDPDNRFWIDIKNAALTVPAIDQNEPDPLVSLRVRQVDPATVRVALSLTGPKSMDVSPTATGLTITVGSDDVADAARTGTGSVGSVISAGEVATPVTPAPLGETDNGSGYDGSWKFGGSSGSTYVPTNPRLIVIDPGHGGSDPGSAHGALVEKDVTLDMADRLRDLLVSRGWQVRLTHDTDVDVFAPNDSAHVELQARDDIANHAGARLFVSIHANAYTNSGPYGTTVYYSKSSDVAFAHLLSESLSNDGTKNDGVIKAHYYVTLHAMMPAALVETAFLTNPSDYALLSSSAWRQKVVEDMADAIDRYAQMYPVSNAPGQ